MEIKLIEAEESKFEKKVQSYIKKGWVQHSGFVYRKKVNDKVYLATNLIMNKK